MATSASHVAVLRRTAPRLRRVELSVGTRGDGPTATFSSAPFLFLSASSAALGALALAAPDLLMNVALPGVPIGAFDSAFVRVAGATMLISCAVEYCLKDAADNGRFTSATYQRLLLGCGLKSIGFLWAFSQASSLWNPVLCAFYPTMAAASAAINLSTLAQVQASPASLLPSWPRTWASKVYGVFALAFLAATAACYAPASLFIAQADQVTAASQLLKHTWAPGYFLSSVACLVIQDAVDRGRASASTFQRLKLGLAAFGGAQSVVLLTLLGQPGSGGWFVPVLFAGSVLVAAHCGLQATLKSG